ncbi:MAG TPA: histidine phosphatase family protein [Acidimicrobiales bacterium]
MLTVVRHGRTEANRSGLLLGRLDVGLDPLGQAQAAAVAAAVGSADRIVCSPLRRTRDTAAAWGVDVEVDDRWIELDYGDLDGTPLRDVDADLWARWRRDVTFAPPAGESLDALGERVRAACDDLADDARTGHVVVVTHVSPIKAAAAWAMGVGIEVSWRMFVAPASVTRIAVGDRGPSLHGFNDVAHLAGVPGG